MYLGHPNSQSVICLRVVLPADSICHHCTIKTLTLPYCHVSVSGEECASEDVDDIMEDDDTAVEQSTPEKRARHAITGIAGFHTLSYN